MTKYASVAVILASFLIVGHASGATYYISSSTGSDAYSVQQAQSKATPWAHLPCMANATNNAAAYKPVAGDTFVLRGGEAWTSGSFPCVWKWSGTSSSRITFGGIDPTWYAGAIWTRPVFTAGGSQISGSRNIFVSFFDYTGPNTGASYVTMDNIELTGFHWTTQYSYGNCTMILTWASSNITFDHLYVHGWTHGAYPGTTDSCVTGVMGYTNPPFDRGSVIQNSIWDGSDSTNGGDMGAATYAFPSVKNSVLHDMPNFLLPVNSGEISGNLLYNCKDSPDPNSHENMLETLQGNGSNGTFYIHDNVFHDSIPGCEAAFLGNPGETDYVWNNVWYNLRGNPPELTQNISPGVAVYFWSNTIVPSSGQYCLRQGHSGSYSVIAFQNNHCITTASAAIDPSLAASTLTVRNNVLQTPTAAAAQGFSATQPYAYSPINNSVATVGAGLDLTSNCTGLMTTSCQDTFYGSFLSGTAVVGIGRRVVSRPSGLPWNAGAYQVGSSTDLSPPATPTNLIIR